eukprot:788836-Prorocentrum_minimum.AAC.5
MPNAPSSSRWIDSSHYFVFCLSPHSPTAGTPQSAAPSHPEEYHYQEREHLEPRASALDFTGSARRSHE